MFGCLGFIVCPLAVWLLWGTAHTLALKIAIGSAIANFWAYGIASNYRGDPQAMPGYASLLSMVSLVTSMALLVFAILA